MSGVARIVLAERAFRTRDKNPYQHLLYSAVRLSGADVREFFYPWNWFRGRPQIVHLHWPEMPIGHPSALRASVQFFLLMSGLRLCRARGARVVWTVHNLEAHEAAEQSRTAFRKWLRNRLWNGLRASLDGWIAHSEDSRAAAVRVHPWLAELPSAVVPHGHYRDEYPDQVSRSEARERFGLTTSDRVLLCFGALRPYRNVPALLEAFRETPGENLRLVVAGDVRDAVLRTRLERIAAHDRRVRLHIGHVPAGDLQLYFRACDLVVLPYREILNSGAALLALSFNRPALLPDRGSMPELQRTVGSDWIRLFSGDISANALQEAVEWAISTRRATKAPLAGLDWNHLADLTVEFYSRVLATGPGSATARGGHKRAR